jgi:hypothetical protein
MLAALAGWHACAPALLDLARVLPQSACLATRDGGWAVDFLVR